MNKYLEKISQLASPLKMDSGKSSKEVLKTTTGVSPSQTVVPTIEQDAAAWGKDFPPRVNTWP